MSSTKPKKWIALIDCDNFFATCEKIFRPYLKQPLVILSNNDGCVISRSHEAKALGIPMGAPFFQYEKFFKDHNVAVFSANFPLYGDMSDRVMSLLEDYSSEIQIYSIDEAFITIPSSIENCEEYGQKIIQEIKQKTGIILSIGIAETKVLAKMANYIAKKNRLGCFFLKPDQKEQILDKVPINEIWGIGGQLTQTLKKYNIQTAWEFCNQEEGFIRKKLSVVGLRLALELKGVSCLPFEELPEPKKSIMSSRSFGTYTSDYNKIAEALSSYTALASEKLRKQGSIASYVGVFLKTNKHNIHQEYYANSTIISLPQASAYTPLLVHAAKLGLKSIYKENTVYKKVGVILGGLVEENCLQMDFFCENEEELRDKQKKIMDLMDSANLKYQKKILKFASEGGKCSSWKMNQTYKSPAYTTSWEQILKIKI